MLKEKGWGRKHVLLFHFVKDYIKLSYREKKKLPLTVYSKLYTIIVNFFFSIFKELFKQLYRVLPVAIHYTLYTVNIFFTEFGLCFCYTFLHMHSYTISMSPFLFFPYLFEKRVLFKYLLSEVQLFAIFGPNSLDEDDLRKCHVWKKIFVF